MSEKEVKERYMRCFDTTENIPESGRFFEQVTWYVDPKDAKTDFEMDEEWAKRNNVKQYIFKVIKESK